MHLEWVMAPKMEKSHFKKRKVRFLLPFHRWEAWRTVNCVLDVTGVAWQSWNWSAHPAMDFSSSWLIPSWNCWCLTHHSSLAQAVSHLTPSDRILCATFKSLWGLEPLEVHPSPRLAVTALLVPTGTAWECCRGMETGCNWSEVRACSCDLHAGSRGKGLQSVFPLPCVC